MIDLLSLVFALISGIMLGAIFFGGLLWTVRKGVSGKHPAIWFFGSMLIRTCTVVLGFYFILGDSWQDLLAGLMGFIAARMFLVRLTRGMVLDGELKQGAGHAP